MFYIHFSYLSIARKKEGTKMGTTSVNQLFIFYNNNITNLAMFLNVHISVGHMLLSVNGSPVAGRTTEDGRDVFDLIEAKVNSYSLRNYSLLIGLTVKPDLTTVKVLKI